MMKWRFGALPVIVVKTPWPLAFVSRSSQYMSTDLPSTREGRQPLSHQRFSPVKLTTPFEFTFADVKVWP